MKEIKFTEKDRVLLLFAIIFGLVFGILGNMFSTMIFRVIDNVVGGLPPETEILLYVFISIVIFTFLVIILFALGSYKIIMPGTKKSKKSKK